MTLDPGALKNTTAKFESLGTFPCVYDAMTILKQTLFKSGLHSGSKSKKSHYNFPLFTAQASCLLTLAREINNNSLITWICRNLLGFGMK